MMTAMITRPSVRGVHRHVFRLSDFALERIARGAPSRRRCIRLQRQPDGAGCIRQPRLTYRGGSGVEFTLPGAGARARIKRVLMSQVKTTAFVGRHAAAAT